MMRTIRFTHEERRAAIRAMLGLMRNGVQFTMAPEATGWALTYPVPKDASVTSQAPPDHE